MLHRDKLGRKPEGTTLPPIPLALCLEAIPTAAVEAQWFLLP
jgi:hypothetical protein